MKMSEITVKNYPEHQKGNYAKRSEILLLDGEESDTSDWREMEYRHTVSVGYCIQEPK